MRRKGIFGNWYGELYVTNQRVAFMKAIMGGAVGAAASRRLGPKIVFDRHALTGVEKQATKRQCFLVVSDATHTERFWLDESTVDSIVNALRARGA